MRVLIVGGAGYIGSHVVRALQRRSYVPIVYDNLSSGHEYLVGKCKLICADLEDRTSLSEALRNIDAVIHLAACCTVAESMSRPREYFNNNVRNSLQLMDACLDKGIEMLVVSSSCAAYGVPSAIPISEDAEVSPINPYGLSKLMVDQMLESYSRAYPLRYVSLRFFNVAGADELGDLVEDHDPETHLIPSALEAILGRRSSVPIYGNNYATSDGTCIRDFVHVSDLAEAHVRALEYLQAKEASHVINIGSGRGYSVIEVLDTIERITNRRVRVDFKDRRPGDPPMLIADIRRAAALLGWRPARNLDDMVLSAWNATCKAERERVLL